MPSLPEVRAVQPRRRGRSFETLEQARERGKYDVVLVAVLSDAGLRRSEASSLTRAMSSTGRMAADASS